MKKKIWHITKDGAVTLCGLDRDKTQDMINVIYAGREPDEGEWCKECHFQDTGLVWEEDENIPCVKCGRINLPLHYNRQCPECFTPPEKSDLLTPAGRKALNLWREHENKTS